MCYLGDAARGFSQCVVRVVSQCSAVCTFLMSGQALHACMVLAMQQSEVESCYCFVLRRDVRSTYVIRYTYVRQYTHSTAETRPSRDQDFLMALVLNGSTERCCDSAGLATLLFALHCSPSDALESIRPAVRTPNRAVLITTITIHTSQAAQRTQRRRSWVGGEVCSD